LIVHYYKCKNQFFLKQIFAAKKKKINNKRESGI